MRNRRADFRKKSKRCIEIYYKPDDKYDNDTPEGIIRGFFGKGLCIDLQYKAIVMLLNKYYIQDLRDILALTIPLAMEEHWLTKNQNQKKDVNHINTM